MALGKGLNSLIPQDSTRGAARKVTRRETGGGTQQVWELSLDAIHANAEQPRLHFDEKKLQDLVNSIQKHGVMQPIVVTEAEEGGYELIAGERRTRAARLAGLATIPAIVRTATEQEKLELALIENIQRQDLNPIEEARAYQRLMDEFNLKQREVAEQVGKSRPAIANTVRLLELPEPIQQGLIDGAITAGKARALLSLKDTAEQQQMYQSMIGEGVTTREVEEAVAAKGQGARKGSVRRDPNIVAQERLLEDRLGTKVKITQTGEKGSIQIQYHSLEELKRLLNELS